jgi:hypothetical protein
LIFAHSFGPWLAGSTALRPVVRQKRDGRLWWRTAGHIMAAREQREAQEGLGLRHILQRYTPRVPLPPASPPPAIISGGLAGDVSTLVSHHLSIVPPPNTALGTKPSTHEPSGHFISRPQHPPRATPRPP